MLLLPDCPDQADPVKSVFASAPPIFDSRHDLPESPGVRSYRKHGRDWSGRVHALLQVLSLVWFGRITVACLAGPRDRSRSKSEWQLGSLM